MLNFIKKLQEKIRNNRKKGESNYDREMYYYLYKARTGKA